MHRLRSALLRVFFSLGTLAAMLLVAETGVRVLSSNELIYDIEMYKYARLLKRRSAVAGLTHEHVPNGRASLMGVDISLNSLGFRGPEVPSRKGRNERRILLLGNSISLGWGVAESGTFASVLERELTRSDPAHRWRVINAGIGNYNSTLENVVLRRLDDLVRPDLVLLQIEPNDPNPIAIRSDDWLIRHSYLEAFLLGRLKELLILRFGARTLEDRYLSLYAPEAPGWIASRRAILAMRARCVSRKEGFLVLIHPDLFDVSGASPLRGCHAVIRRFLSANRISFVDVIDAYEKAFVRPQDAWVAKDDRHPNARGHALIARALVEPVLRAALP